MSLINIPSTLHILFWPVVILFAVAAIVVGFATFLQLLGKGKEEKYELLYERKPYLLTMSERKLFNILNEFLLTYYVFPQIQIKSIVNVKKGAKYRRALFSHIAQKSVDFVVFDKENIGPLLVIELDDATHERPDRMERDRQVNELFAEAKIQILHIKTAELENPTAIKENITRILQKN